MTPRPPKTPEAISLDEFRNAVQPSPPDLDEMPSGLKNFVPVDYPTFHMSRIMVSGLIGEFQAEDFGIVQRVNDDPRLVDYSKDDGCWIGVNKNRDDLETLTIDLELADEMTEAQLREPLERFYLLSLVACKLLVAERRFNLKVPLPNPNAGVTEINITDNMQEVNAWRTAAGLGILAVGAKRPRLRYNMRHHLNNVLSGRLQYMQSQISLSKILHASTPEMESDESMVSNYLIGICSPLYAAQIGKMIKPPKNLTNSP